MKIPRVSLAAAYAGMYAFDFGEWTSVGYTAEEIRFLLESAEHNGGDAYRIHRVDGHGRMELMGVTVGDLAGEEMMLFASRGVEQADADYAELARLGDQTPGPADVELVVVEIPDLEPPYAAGMIYPAHAAYLVSSWLSAVGFNGGEVALGGGEVAVAYRESGVVPRKSCRLPAENRYNPRSREEVLRTVREPIQR